MATRKPARKTAKSVTRKDASSKARRPAGGAATQANVTVRMFCQGLGDCFLITIPQDRSRPYSILVDFGLALGTPKGDAIMKRIVDELAKLTQGTIDLCVVTHEHWDHVSGFVLAAAELKQKLTFRHLWMAWTEKKDDPLAKSLRDEFQKAKLALTQAFQATSRLQGLDDTSVRRLQALNGVLAFYGPAAAKKGGSVADAMALPHELVNEKANPDAVDYLRPGDCLTLPGATGPAAGIQAFVLGPPMDRRKLRRLDPGEKEGYEKKKGDLPGVSFNWSWMAGVGAAGEAAGAGAAFPFDGIAGLPLDEAKTDARFASYFAADKQCDVRRIDNDWLWSGAQRLALKMDNYTNNTSLVLALELPKSRQVLLFAADAQAGNWLSWHDQEYTTKDGRQLKCVDLLSRTSLYKVGHHGSHNATLKGKGLELMTAPDLVAMLPVEADGVTRLRYGQMPLKSLVDALRDKTDGRILRMDEAWTKDKAPGTWKKPGLRASLSRERITVGDGAKSSKRALYMELTMRDA